MEKRVKRSEVNITIGSKSPTKSPLKDSSFPDADALAQKYGVLEPQEIVQPPPQVSTSVSSRSEVELLRKLEEKNRKIDQLCTLLEALEPAPGVDAERIQKLLDEGIDENVDFRDAKIVSLAKKSHRLTMQLNKEKSITDKLNQQVLDLQKNIASLNQELQVAKANSGKSESSKVYNRNAGTAEPTVDDLQTTIASLQKDLKEGAKQTEELKRKLAQSVEENKQLSRALARELGEGVTLEQAVSGGWRGRAQQIIMLKNKVKKLEEGLAATAQGTVSGSGYGQQSASTIAGGAGTMGMGAGTASVMSVDRKAEEDLAAMSQDRRQIVEALTQEREQLMEANQQLEKKAHAQKARIHNLEADARKMKDSLQLVLDKSATDDQLLDALRAEISRLKGQLQQTQQQLQAQQLATAGGAGRSVGEGISTKFSMAGSTLIGSTMDKGKSVAGGKGGALGGSVMADSLDFLQAQQLQQQESYEAEIRQLQAEVVRLRRLCKNQSDQLETQDGTIRQLKKKLHTDYQS